VDYTIFIQWFLVIGSSLILILLSPRAKDLGSFFKAATGDKKPSVFLLTSSLVISWIFAKSITNAANLGLKYGIMGGIAYACYYLSFLVAGIVIFKMRRDGGFMSIHHFLDSKFGKTAVILFSVLIAFRLFNEVWSNTMVIGLYFGVQGSGSYFLAIGVFTILTLIYSIKGGLSSSLFTDLIQIILFGILLLVILAMILPDLEAIPLPQHLGFSGGVNLMLVALLQSFSYPFHDPVMTDRGFITDPKVMRKSFFLAAPIGFVAILLFSLIGVYAKQLGVVGDATVKVAESSGIVLTLLINFIMITSASSTLDSAFASFSKLAVIDLKMINATISSGRIVMVVMALLGTIPIFLNAEILSATTVSGTMVIGLAPIFLFWNKDVPRYTFTAVVLVGLVLGIAYALDVLPDCTDYIPGDYGNLLAVNLVGSVICFLLFFLFSLQSQKSPLTD